VPVTEPGLDAAVRAPAGAREIACPLCGVTGGPRLRGYDRKAGREVFEFLGLPAGASQWTACRGCGFVYQNPRPDPARVIALYERGLYREHREYSEHFFRNRYRYPVEHYRWLAGRVDVPPAARILDIGAGFGGAVRAFRDLGARAEGIEADPGLCAAAPARFGVELRPGDVETVPLGEAGWDVIYSAHTHEHFADVVGVTRRLRGRLVPGGHLLIVLPTFRFGARNAQGFLNVFHLSMFTARTLARLFVRTGFEPLAFRYPLEHSRPEVWGIARRVEGAPAAAPRPDAARRVAWEIERAPAVFERLYRVTDVPLRGARALRRRLEGRTRWPEWTGSRA
jgi:SAM-dependent methyltransferase